MGKRIHNGRYAHPFGVGSVLDHAAKRPRCDRRDDEIGAKASD